MFKINRAIYSCSVLVYGKASSKIEAKNHNFEQSAVIKFFVNLRKSPTETKQMIDTTGDGVHVSRSMVF